MALDLQGFFLNSISQGDELKGENLKETVHQVCMAHLRAKFRKALEQGKDECARVFMDTINRLYALERSYDAEEISAEERTLRRQGLATKSLLIDLRQYLDLELSKPRRATQWLFDRDRKLSESFLDRIDRLCARWCLPY